MELAQGHTLDKWLSQDSNQGSLTLEHMLLVTMLYCKGVPTVSKIIHVMDS